MSEIAESVLQRDLPFETIVQNINQKKVVKPKPTLVQSADKSKSETITYEQPINEHTRSCLRLEYLFEQLDYYLGTTANWDNHHCLTCICDVLQLLDRPDLKSKLTHELKRQLLTLQHLQSRPQINNAILENTIVKIKQAVLILCETKGKFGQALREHEFIAYLKPHLNSPASTCSFDTPLYHYWQALPAGKKQKDLKRWIATFSEIRSIIKLMLKLIRDSGHQQLVTTYDGFYQQALPQNVTQHLIQVKLPKNLAAVPEISAGKQRLCVRFLYPNIHEKPTSYKEEITFELTCCGL